VRERQRMGSSVLGMADVHRKLLPFVQQWMQRRDRHHRGGA
jgi:hypothetical protein